MSPLPVETYPAMKGQRVTRDRRKEVQMGHLLVQQAQRRWALARSDRSALAQGWRVLVQASCPLAPNSPVVEVEAVGRSPHERPGRAAERSKLRGKMPPPQGTCKWA